MSGATSCGESISMGPTGCVCFRRQSDESQGIRRPIKIELDVQEPLTCLRSRMAPLFDPVVGEQKVALEAERRPDIAQFPIEILFVAHMIQPLTIRDVAQFRRVSENAERLVVELINFRIETTRDERIK